MSQPEHHIGQQEISQRVRLLCLASSLERQPCPARSRGAWEKARDRAISTEDHGAEHVELRLALPAACSSSMIGPIVWVQPAYMLPRYHDALLIQIADTVVRGTYGLSNIVPM
eukprot:SAG31_NODE_485_length_15021_cov_9.439791_1_plen_113_part_00